MSKKPATLQLEPKAKAVAAPAPQPEPKVASVAADAAAPNADNIAFVLLSENQRIGRVHRLGQQHSVQVVNFVAEGSIEQRMLSLLDFKRSLFAGVLDGGEKEVFLGGSRLQQFMKSVSAVTEDAESEAAESEVPRRKEPGTRTVNGAEPALATSPVRNRGNEETNAYAGADTPQETDSRAHDQPSLARASQAQPLPSQPAPAQSASLQPVPEQPASYANPWAPLLSAGLALMQSLNAAVNSSHAADNGERPSAASPWIERDATTGRSYLKLPMPEPQTVQQLGEALTRLLAGFGR
ncbi:MAG: hypothetical protein HC872_01015 [Gammaproteobacteria bacterium]|nr:hypothetical protein [Gammaproteobacteria bacterium]